MSDFSLLYKKYTSVSKLTNDLNNSIITLKRKNVARKPAARKQHPGMQVSDTEVAKAQHKIGEILSELQEFYRDQDPGSELYELMDNDMFQKEILHNTTFKIQIIKALDKIRSRADLNGKDLSNIDKFISILDNEAAVLFRKLRTNRG